MRTRLLAVVLGLLPGLLASAAAAPRIVLDPGHGGTQDGAAGPDGLLEKKLCLELALRVKAALESTLGAQVMLTRDRDATVSLADRVARVNVAKPDLFLSLHANSMPTRAARERAKGIETFFLSASASGQDASATAARENAELAGAAAHASADPLSAILTDLAKSETLQDSSRLAYSLHTELIRELHAENRGVQQAPFYVLTGVDAPSVLIEVGFISHPREGRKLATAAYQSQMARAITRGVAKFLKEVSARDARGAASARP